MSPSAPTGTNNKSVYVLSSGFQTVIREFGIDVRKKERKLNILESLYFTNTLQLIRTGKLSRYSDWLRAGPTGFHFRYEQKIFPPLPNPDQF
jgi:hypothetical protein